MNAKRSPVGSGEKGRKQEPNKKKQEEVDMKDRHIKKSYLKSRNACKVTFRVFKEAVPDAHQVCLVGDFNEWNIRANPMKRLKKGDFTTHVELQPGREYHFRYYIDNSRWDNDWQADKYVPNPFGDSDNSVVVV